MKKRRQTSVRISGLLLSIVVAAACQTSAEPLAPATVSLLTPAQTVEIQRIVAAAVGQQQVRVSNSAFAQTHILVLEPAMRRTPLGTVATGTTTTKPPTFHLLGNGLSCQLYDVGNNVRHTLTFSCGMAP